MLQNGGCNRKSTLLAFKGDDDIVMKFIPEWSKYSLVRCTRISVFFFVFRLYEKPQHVQSFQDFKKFICYINLKICQYIKSIPEATVVLVVNRCFMDVTDILLIY